MWKGKKMLSQLECVESALGFVSPGPPGCLWVCFFNFFSGGGVASVAAAADPGLDSELVFVLAFTLPTPAVTQRDNRGEEGVLSEWEKINWRAPRHTALPPPPSLPSPRLVICI